MSIHDHIAQDVINGKVAIITCHTCGRTEEVTQTDFAKYLRGGWPKCHGQTMELRLSAKED